MKDHDDDDGKRSAGCSSWSTSGYTPPEKRQQTRRDWITSSSSPFSSSSPIETTNESFLFSALDYMDNTAREAREVLEAAPTENNMCLAKIEIMSIQRQISYFKELLYMDIESGGELNNSSSATTAVDESGGELNNSSSTSSAVGLLLPFATDDHETVSSSATTAVCNVQPFATDDHAREEVIGRFNMIFSPIRSSSTTYTVDFTRRTLATGGDLLSSSASNLATNVGDTSSSTKNPPIAVDTSSSATNTSPPAALPTAILSVTNTTSSNTTITSSAPTIQQHQTLICTTDDIAQPSATWETGDGDNELDFGFGLYDNDTEETTMSHSSANASSAPSVAHASPSRPSPGLSMPPMPAGAMLVHQLPLDSGLNQLNNPRPGNSPSQLNQAGQPLTQQQGQYGMPSTTSASTNTGAPSSVNIPNGVGGAPGGMPPGMPSTSPAYMYASGCVPGQFNQMGHPAYGMQAAPYGYCQQFAPQGQYGGYSQGLMGQGGGYGAHQHYDDQRGGPRGGNMRDNHQVGGYNKRVGGYRGNHGGMPQYGGYGHGGHQQQQRPRPPPPPPPPPRPPNQQHHRQKPQLQLHVSNLNRLRNNEVVNTDIHVCLDYHLSHANIASNSFYRCKQNYGFIEFNSNDDAERAYHILRAKNIVIYDSTIQINVSTNYRGNYMVQSKGSQSTLPPQPPPPLRPPPRPLRPPPRPPPPPPLRPPPRPQPAACPSSSMTVSGSDTAHCIASACAIIISTKTDCIADVEAMESTLQVAASPSDAGDAMESIAAVSAKKEREEDERNVVESKKIEEAEVNATKNDEDDQQTIPWWWMKGVFVKLERGYGLDAVIVEVTSNTASVMLVKDNSIQNVLFENDNVVCVTPTKLDNVIVNHPETNRASHGVVVEIFLSDTVCIRVKLTDGSIKCFDFDDVAKINEAVSNDDHDDDDDDDVDDDDDDNNNNNSNSSNNSNNNNNNNSNNFSCIHLTLTKKC